MATVCASASQFVRITSSLANARLSQTTAGLPETDCVAPVAPASIDTDEQLRQGSYRRASSGPAQIPAVLCESSRNLLATRHRAEKAIPRNRKYTRLNKHDALR